MRIGSVSPTPPQVEHNSDRYPDVVLVNPTETAGVQGQQVIHLGYPNGKLSPYGIIKAATDCQGGVYLCSGKPKETRANMVATDQPMRKNSSSSPSMREFRPC
jgi:hypothetical protein